MTTLNEAFNRPSDAELKALEARTKVAAPALADFCKENGIFLPRDECPVIGVALSGGGWRSMLSSAAFLDGLSELELLDGVTYVAGVSGGSWCVLQYMLSEDQHNPLHSPNTPNHWIHSSSSGPTQPHPHPNEGTGPKNPFAPTDGEGVSRTGSGKRPPAIATPRASSMNGRPTEATAKPNRFDSTLHRYEGLIKAVGAQTIRAAARMSGDLFSKLCRKTLEAVLGEITIPHVMFDETMGDGYVERWANFLASNLLAWKSGGPPPPPGTPRLQRSESRSESFPASPMNADGELHIPFPTPENDETLINGRKPILICSAVADSDCEKSGFDWVEFTPYGSRRYSLKPEKELATLLTTYNSESANAFGDSTSSESGPPSAGTESFDTTDGSSSCKPLPTWSSPTRPRGWLRHDELYGNVKWPRNHTHDQDGERRSAKEQAEVPLNRPPKPEEVKDLKKKGFIPLSVHHLMAICGSAFAIGWRNLPVIGPVLRSNKPILGGVTRVPGLGVLRDAGCCNNIPFTALLQNSSGRKVDILIVMEASHGAKGCERLLEAEELGYFEISDATKNFAFLDGHRTRIFTPSNPNSRMPTIVYFLGKTDRSVFQVTLTEDQVRADCEQVRGWVRRELVDNLRIAINSWTTKVLQAKAFFRDLRRRSSQETSLMLSHTDLAAEMELPPSYTAIFDPNSPTFMAKRIRRKARSWLAELGDASVSFDDFNALDVDPRRKHPKHNPFLMLGLLEGELNREGGLDNDDDVEAKRLDIARRTVQQYVLESGKQGADMLVLQAVETPPSSPLEGGRKLFPHFLRERILSSVPSPPAFGSPSHSFAEEDLPPEKRRAAENVKIYLGAYYVALHYGRRYFDNADDDTELIFKKRTPPPAPADCPDLPEYFSVMDGAASHAWTLMAWMAVGNRDAQLRLFDELKRSFPLHLEHILPELGCSLEYANLDLSEQRKNLRRTLGLETVLRVANMVNPSGNLHFLFGDAMRTLGRTYTVKIQPTYRLMIVETAALVNHTDAVNFFLDGIDEPKLLQRCVDAALVVARSEANDQLIASLLQRKAAYAAATAKAPDVINPWQVGHRLR